ncbi:MAG: hypothetical protein Q8N44_05620 [Rubrivivax sp.]|nr:hypothetical protein [Rubrivivax sp.]
MNRRHLALPAAAASLFALGLSSAALAETSPYYIGASQTLTHESNLLRLSKTQAAPAGFSKSDTVSSTALLAGFDQPISRQRVFGNVTLRANRLSHNSVYDNEGHALSAGIDWATVANLSGRVSASANRNLARFNAEELGLVTKKNVEDTRQFEAVARLGVVTRYTLEASASHRSVSYSAAEYASREFRQDSGSLGLQYRPSSATRYGAALRLSHGQYPQFRPLFGGGFEADRYDRRDIDFTASVAPSAVSSFEGRLSLGKTDYEIANQRDFSGVTGAFAWNWRPTGKVRFNTRLSRDIGQDSYFIDRGFFDGTIDYSRVTTALRARADYDWSAKVSFNAVLGLAHRSLVRTLPTGLGVPTSASGTDRGTTLTLGARWTPTRTTVIGCDASSDERRGNSTLSANLSASSLGCYGQITLQ